MSDLIERLSRSEVLDQARGCVCTDRNDRYGEPEDVFTAIGDLWTSYILQKYPEIRKLVPGFGIDAFDCELLMVLFKVARAVRRKETDSLIDIIGYAACAGEQLGLINKNRVDPALSELLKRKAPAMPTEKGDLPWHERNCPADESVIGVDDLVPEELYKVVCVDVSDSINKGYCLDVTVEEVGSGEESSVHVGNPSDRTIRAVRSHLSNCAKILGGPLSETLGAKENGVEDDDV